MSAFIYYISNFPRQLITPAEFAAIGFAHALLPGKSVSSSSADGPDGSRGLFCVAEAARELPVSDLIAYVPAAQTWRKIPGKENLWVGIWNDRKPTPADLALPQQLAGLDVMLGDGNAWRVARVLGAVPGRPTALGRVYQLGDDGRYNARVAPRYLPLLDRARELLEVACRKRPDDWTLDQQIALAVDVLALQYRIGAIEADLLGLFESGTLTKAMFAVCDFDELVRHAAVRNPSNP